MRALKPTLLHSRLLELLDYNPKTGVFRNRVDRSTGISRVTAGRVCGTKNVSGYGVVSVDGKRHYAHRLAWFYVHGEWPPADIDHINFIKTDNRIANLRCATRAQNIANRRTRKDCASGFKGVVKTNRKKGPPRFCSFISDDGKLRYIGTFDTPEEANEAYMKEAARLHGEFARAA